MVEIHAQRQEAASGRLLPSRPLAAALKLITTEEGLKKHFGTTEELRSTTWNPKNH